MADAVVRRLDREARPATLTCVQGLVPLYERYDFRTTGQTKGWAFPLQRAELVEMVREPKGRGLHSG